MGSSRLYLLRPAELVLKSTPVRRRMMRILAQNLECGLQRKGISYTLQRQWDRFFLEAPPEAESILRHLFGLRSFSPVQIVPTTTQLPILEAAERYFAPHVQNHTFAVRTRRSPSVALSSRAIERDLGARLVAAGGRVDLDHPEVTCYVEIRENHTFLYTVRVKGAGGLPLGVSAPVLALISGGFDSAVAAWSMMHRGVPVRFLFFELGGCAHRAGVLSVVLHLYETWMHGDEGAWIDIVPGKVMIDRLQDRIPPRYWNVMLKRIFYQVAYRIANEDGLLGLVTGEAIGQVSSQTLPNLYALSTGISFPIWRPLLTMEKEEIIQKSRDIGTASISESVQEYCAITPRKAATHVQPERILEMEAKLGGDPWYVHLASLKERIYLRDLDWTQVHHLEVSIDEPPPHAIWIDLREEGPSLPSTAEVWRMRPIELRERMETLDPSKTYVLFCARGMLSAELAFLMRQKGLRAYAYRGGVRRLFRHAHVS